MRHPYGSEKNQYLYYYKKTSKTYINLAIAYKSRQTDKNDKRRKDAKLIINMKVKFFNFIIQVTNVIKDSKNI